MTLAELQALRRQYNEAVKVLRDINDLAEKENRGLKPEELITFRNAEAKVDELKERIERGQKVMEREAERNLVTQGGNREDRGLQMDPDDDDDVDPESPDAKAKREQDAQFQRFYRRAFNGFIRGGMDNLTPRQRTLLQQRRTVLSQAELRDLSVGTSAAGGYTVAQDFYNRLIEAQKAWGGIAQAATVITTATGATMPVSTESDIGNPATIVGEAVQGNTSVDATFGAVNMGSFMYRTLVKVSMELLQDSAFDIEGYISRKFGIRFGRGMNAHYTTGDGSGKPTGITAASGGAATGKTGTTGQTVTVIYNDLIDLEHSVDPLYRSLAQWQWHDSTLKAIKKLVDGQSRPIWMPDYTTNGGGFPSTVLGYKYTINQDMPVMAANAKSIAFGDFGYYFVRQVMGMVMLRLVERYADFGQVGFIGFMRADGKYINANDPIKLYVNSAT